MKKKYFLFQLLLFLVSSLNAQNKYTLPQVTPKSPNTAAFDKYGDIPVSLSAGTISVSIPLMSISAGNVLVPVTLSYNNNGLKTDEIPSWVGLGWNLSAGGLISYNQRGQNDFDSLNGLCVPNSGALTDLKNFLNGAMTPTQQYDYLERVINDDEDSEFDLYHFNFPGHSGAFYFDTNQTVVLVPKSDLKVTKVLGGFEIVDATNNEFYFTQTETSITSPLGAVEVRKPFTGTSAYYLSRIHSANNKELRFVYTSYDLEYTRVSAVIDHAVSTPHSECPGSSLDFPDTYNYQTSVLLDSIVSDIGFVKLNHSTAPREDLKKINSGISVPYLSSIVLKNYEDEFITEYDLSYSYFGSNDRLKLVSVIQKNSLGSDDKKWQFTYNGETTSFPAFFSYSKDHWGYYNGAFNSSAIPNADYYSFIPGWRTYNISYADRRSNFDASVIGTLKTITYPTGGTSEFEYEPNQISVRSYKDIFQYVYLNFPDQVFTYNNPNETIDLNTNQNANISGSFTITDAAIVYVYGFTQMSQNGFYTSLLNITGPSANEIINATHENCISTGCSGGKNILILPGTYNYTLTQDGYTDENNNYVSFNSGLKIVNENVVPYQIGGCRIKKITTSDSSSVNQSSIKTYQYDDSLQNVIFRNIPTYHTSMTLRSGNGLFSVDCGPRYRIHDENVKPSAGSLIEYVNVIEKNDENGNSGETHHSFTTSENFGGGGEPYAAVQNTEWRVGQEKQQRIYKKTSTENELINEETSDYHIGNRESITNGIKVDYSQYNTISNSLERIHRYSLSTNSTEQYYRNESDKWDYDGSTALHQNSKYYFLSSAHNLPTLVENSANESTIKEKIIYSFDYNTQTTVSSEAIGIKNCNDHNVLVPIERIQIRNILGTDYVTGGTITTYKSSEIIPDKIWSLKVSIPFALNTFTESFIDNNGNFIKDSRYEERLDFSSYDTYNNILQQNKSNDFSFSYIWDYKNNYPIAEITNAPQSGVAYTSFEADGIGNWSGINSSNIQATGGLTGNKYYNQTGFTLSRSGLSSSSSYIVTYWSKAGSYTISGTSTGYPKTLNSITIGSNTWTLYEHLVTGQTTITLSGSGSIDELRLYPKGAQMTTYTYTPLIGISSQCDANNRISYYEYDSFGQLNHIRDQDQNILKTYDYKYASQ